MSANKANTGSKAKRNRKTRTAVSPPPSSGQDEGASPEPHHTEIEKGSDNLVQDSISGEDDNLDELDAEPVFTKRNVDPEKNFEELYLRQATKEFANDLEKLRNASDFKDKSVPMLVDALKQGTACFSREEREKIGKAVSISSA